MSPRLSPAAPTTSSSAGLSRRRRIGVLPRKRFRRRSLRCSRLPPPDPEPRSVFDAPVVVPEHESQHASEIALVRLLDPPRPPCVLLLQTGVAVGELWREVVVCGDQKVLTRP